ncbi:carboxymuconolactone decarboxylase family protein [Paenibacillus sp. JDR-2]|uniref:carboxymuconolactone decarboxylase family protein n=1 Tax=Paenibacillus sp. (strain JDR-2) TaxID=324057 RepID=UPI00016654E0|nr:carboxymuconolactone decarboxylase family protein [Paenibacillus sp. JDR-2]ACT01577.1 alkylhydroperoxidase like protein, AhpD family [Paenibacillus sp. JDR-2]
MKIRLDYRTANPAAFQALMKLEGVSKQLNPDKTLYELIKIRASQINGCAFCLDMHTADARKLGESEQRINLVAVWKEAPQFTARERAALALTEAVTLISNAGVPQDVYDEVRRHFTDEEYVGLILAINAINSWNRVAIATGMFPGCFES